MKKIAIYPGSFDPIHNGHIDIINRISKQFDSLIVLVAESTQKKSLFLANKRKKLIEKSLTHLNNTQVDIFSGLTVDYARKKNAQIIIRGLRAVVDFEYEMTMASLNKKLAPEIETMLVFATPEFYYLSSRGIKEVAINHGKLTGLVPLQVENSLIKESRGRHARKKSKKS